MYRAKCSVCGLESDEASLQRLIHCDRVMDRLQKLGIGLISQTHDPFSGYWEYNLGTLPVWIRSREHFKKELKKRGLVWLDYKLKGRDPSSLQRQKNHERVENERMRLMSGGRDEFRAYMEASTHGKGDDFVRRKEDARRQARDRFLAQVGGKRWGS